jgi:hypothetical protein
VLRPGVLSLAASVEVPANPLGRYVNVQALLRETGGLPAFEELSIGRLPVPDVRRRLGARARAAVARSHDGYQVAADSLRSVSIADGNLRIVYEWRDDLPGRVGNVLLPPAEREADEGLPGAPRAVEPRCGPRPAAYRSPRSCDRSCRSRPGAPAAATRRQTVARSSPSSRSM